MLKWIWKKGSGASDLVLFPLAGLSLVYGMACRSRIFLYEKGVLPRRRVDCHVVSIGNLTVGGTGKTPFTIFLAEQWRERGYSVGIVSRGYRGSYKGPALLVSDGERILETPAVVGDEPYLLAERLKGIPVIVSSDRFKGAQRLLDRFKIEVLLLDDGFQHIRLHRDLNILLVDSTNPFGNGFLLPRGGLREPLSEVRRADLVVFTRSDRRLANAEWVSEIERFGRPCLRTAFQPTRLAHIGNGLVRPASDLAGQRIVSFCGIGNPDSFLKTLEGLGAKIEEDIRFSDHFAYRPSDIEAIREKVRRHGVKWVVTTEKDAVKIRPLLPPEVDLWALQVEVVFWEEPEKWKSLLFRRSNSPETAPGSKPQGAPEQRRRPNR